MFRAMRRSKQQIPETEAVDILKNATSGVLGVSGDDGYPYTVPVSHVYQDHKLYFHCAREGHKFDGILRNDKVSYCVIAKDEVNPSTFSTDYLSVILFGKARILTEAGERQAALEALVRKFSPGYFEEGLREIERDWDRVCVVEIAIKHLTGKRAKVSGLAE